MVKIETNRGCCDLPCIGSTCPYHNRVTIECDECGCSLSVNEVYKDNDKMLCEDCMVEVMLDRAEKWTPEELFGQENEN